MRRLCLGLAALILTASAALADGMIFASTDALKWGDAPAALPKGMQLAVIAGDPGKAGPYVIRVKIPTGYQLPAHWHSTAENLTVLSGAVNVVMGARLDEKTSTKLEMGGFAYLPSKMNHFLLGERADDLPDTCGRSVRHRLCESE